MRTLSRIFLLLAFLLCSAMCAVVAWNWRDMLCGIAHSCYSAPAWVALLSGIPFLIGIGLCLALAWRFRKKARKTEE